MILGIGTDLTPHARIERLLDRHGERALVRLFTEGERRYCLALARPVPSLAARFAAKEAVFKALGTGVGRGGRWTDVEILRSDLGAPRVLLHGRAARLARRRNVRRIHLSLSHTDDLAIAHVVLER